MLKITHLNFPAVANLLYLVSLRTSGKRDPRDTPPQWALHWILAPAHGRGAELRAPYLGRRAGYRGHRGSCHGRKHGELLDIPR